MTSSNLARVTLAASIDAAKSGRSMKSAMRIAAKAEANEDAFDAMAEHGGGCECSVCAPSTDGPCFSCGGVDSHLDACPVINEGRDTHFYSERSLGGRPW